MLPNPIPQLHIPNGNTSRPRGLLRHARTSNSRHEHRRFQHLHACYTVSTRHSEWARHGPAASNTRARPHVGRGKGGAPPGDTSAPSNEGGAGLGAECFDPQVAPDVVGKGGLLGHPVVQEQAVLATPIAGGMVQ